MSNLQKYGVPTGEGKYHEEILYSLALLYNRLSHDISNFLKDYDLSMGKINILLAIKHHGGPEGIRQVEISNHLIVTASNMTKMIDKLEKEGLVARHALEGDRRVNMVKITPKGEALLEAIWPKYTIKLKEAVSTLSKDKQQALSGLLTGWLEVIL